MPLMSFDYGKFFCNENMIIQKVMYTLITYSHYLTNSAHLFSITEVSWYTCKARFCHSLKEDLSVENTLSAAADDGCNSRIFLIANDQCGSLSWFLLTSFHLSWKSWSCYQIILVFCLQVREGRIVYEGESWKRVNICTFWLHLSYFVRITKTTCCKCSYTCSYIDHDWNLPGNTIVLVVHKIAHSLPPVGKRWSYC